MEDFETLQNEVFEWSTENFGDQPDINPFLGTEEEAGELADRLDLDSEPDEEEIDAVGDILVYIADFCARRGLSMQAAYEISDEIESKHADFFQEWVGSRGQLTRSVLKQRQGIRQDEDRVGDEAEERALARMLNCLSEFAEKRGYSLEDCVNEAWYDEVIDREWNSRYN